MGYKMKSDSRKLKSRQEVERPFKLTFEISSRFGMCESCILLESENAQQFNLKRESVVIAYDIEKAFLGRDRVSPGATSRRR